MTVLLFLIFLFFFSVFMLFYTSKRQKEQQNIINESSSKADTLTAYQVYLNWCKKNELMFVPEDEFNKLKNENGNVDISDMLALHPEFQAKLVLKRQENEAMEKLKEEERKKAGQQFGNSAIIGYLTNSTVAGTLFGGSLFSGMLGSHLSKKKKNK